MGEKKKSLRSASSVKTVSKREEREREKSHSVWVQRCSTPTWDPFNLDQRSKGRGGPGLSGKLVTTSPSAMLLHSGDPTPPDCQRGQVRRRQSPFNPLQRRLHFFNHAFCCGWLFSAATLYLPLIILVLISDFAWFFLFLTSYLMFNFSVSLKHRPTRSNFVCV